MKMLVVFFCLVVGSCFRKCVMVMQLEILLLLVKMVSLCRVDCFSCLCNMGEVLCLLLMVCCVQWCVVFLCKIGLVRVVCRCIYLVMLLLLLVGMCRQWKGWLGCLCMLVRKMLVLLMGNDCMQLKYLCVCLVLLCSLYCMFGLIFLKFLLLVFLVLELRCLFRLFMKL